MTKKQIALCLGIDATTFFRRQKDDKLFVAAMERGEAAAIAAVTGALLKQVNLNNVTAMIFFLKCRAGWKETTIIENRDVPPVPDDGCSLEDAENAYINAMRGK